MNTRFHLPRRFKRYNTAVKRLFLLLFALLSGAHAAPYVGQDPGGVYYLDLLEQNGRLSGTFQAVYATPDPVPKVQVSNLSVRGQATGASLTLEVGTATWSGERSASTLVLKIPRRTGGVDTLTLSALNTAQYNARVEAFKATVAQQAAGVVQRMNAERELHSRERAFESALEEVLEAERRSARFVERFDEAHTEAQEALRELQASGQQVIASARHPMDCLDLNLLKDVELNTLENVEGHVFKSVTLQPARNTLEALREERQTLEALRLKLTQTHAALEQMGQGAGHPADHAQAQEQVQSLLRGVDTSSVAWERALATLEAQAEQVLADAQKAVQAATCQDRP